MKIRPGRAPQRRSRAAPIRAAAPAPPATTLLTRPSPDREPQTGRRSRRFRGTARYPGFKHEELGDRGPGASAAPTTTVPPITS
jgi:hypothetical protein